MKNTKKAKIILGISIATAFLATVTASLTWFDNRVNLNPSINGSSAAAYFAYGNGSKEYPYGIKTPRHLYNLAWLQYLGEFNKTGVSQPVYFELADNVDMTTNSNIGALPPIGNSKYPFTGVFNGKEKTISNLTISDSFSDFKTTPYSVTNGDYKSDNILGMFGVIGDSAKETNPDTSVSDFNLENPVIKSTGEKALAGIVAGYVNASVSSIGVIEPKIQLEYSSTSGTAPLGTDSSLSNTNFTNISDYSVVGYCTDKYKSSVSSSVTEMTKTNIKTEMVPNAPGGSGSGLTDWGGSIDMKELYDRLQARKSKSTPIQYTTNVEMNSDGSQKETKADVKINSWENAGEKYTDLKYPVYSPISGNLDYYFGFKEYSKTNDSNKKTSSISFIDSPYAADTNVIALTGGAERYIIDGKTIDFSSTEDASKHEKRISIFYELNGNDKIYLKTSLNSDGKVNMSTTSSPSEASLIHLERDLTSTNTPYTISVIHSGTTYYLNKIESTSTSTDKSGNIDVEFNTNTPSKWLYDSQATAFCLEEDPQFYFSLNSLDANSQNWGLNAGGFSYYLSSKTNGNQTYFNNDNDNGFNVSSQKDEKTTSWFLKDDLVYRIRKDNKENKPVYLTLDKSVGMKTSTSTTNHFSYLLSDDDTKAYIYKIKDSNIYYPVVSNSGASTKWDLSSKACSKNPSDEEIKSLVVPLNMESGTGFPFLFGGQDNDNSNITVDSQFSTPDTYISLQEESEGVPSNSNTGYIVGGTDYYGDYSGDMRISRYLHEGPYNINNSLGNGKKLSNVYSIKIDGTTIESTKVDYNELFSKYSTSKEQVEEAISGDYIYGLHFMNANVGTRRDGKYVTIPSATINGKQYENYQVPDDCIDFSLKEDGYINFFAGNYDNFDCFFSLHEIKRDSNNNISSINEIQQIYKAPTKINIAPATSTSPSYVDVDNINYRISSKEPKFKYSYKSSNSTAPTWKVEKYENGNWSILTNGRDQEKEFEGDGIFNATTQLGIHKDNQNNSTLKSKSAYYFEIPVNAGEYALGSVEGGNGAYLMYLDIGTNSGLNADVTRTIISESMTITTSRYSSFMGVTFISAGNSGSSNTYCIVLKSGATGNIVFDDTGVETNKTGTGASPTWVEVSFKKDNSVVKINGTEAEYTNPIKEKAVTTIKRVTYIDVLANGTKNMVQVTSTTTKKNDETEASTETTRTYYSIDETGKLTVSNNRLYFADANGHDMEESALDKLPQNAEYSTEKMLSFQLETKLFGTIHISFKASYKYDSANKTYSIGGYNILITGNNLAEDTKVTITKISSNTYNFTFNDEKGEETIILTIPKSSVSSN